jgi:hypothetical protein
MRDGRTPRGARPANRFFSRRSSPFTARWEYLAMMGTCFGAMMIMMFL